MVPISGVQNSANYNVFWAASGREQVMSGVTLSSGITISLPELSCEVLVMDLISNI